MTKKLLSKSLLAPLSPLPKASSPRVAIYTAFARNYGRLRPIEFSSPGYDFVAFSDRAVEVDGWKVLPINYIHKNPLRSERFIKLHPHLYFSDYDVSIWIDADIQPGGDIAGFIEAVSQDVYLAACSHPQRECIFKEITACVQRQEPDSNILLEQQARYERQGFPERAGLWQTDLLVRRHNDPRCIRLMNEWWREIEVGSHWDQVSLPVVRRRLNATIAPLVRHPIDLRHDPRPAFLPREHAVEVAGVKEPPKYQPRPVDLSALTIDIGICVHNSPRETREALASAEAERRRGDRIIIVDDGSDKETATILDVFAQAHDNVLLLRHDECEGYTRSANAVLKAAKADWIVLLNSDAILSKHALQKLITCGEQYDRLAIVGPLSNAGGWQTVPILANPGGGFYVNSIPSPLTVENMDRICEEVSRGAPLFTPLVNGFCFAIRRSALEAIGLFDDRAFPKGYGEEDDFCLRAADAGYVCGVATNTYVFHHKSASFKVARRATLAKASGIALREKHGADRVTQSTQMLRENPELVRLRQVIGERQKMLLSTALGTAPSKG